MQFIRGSRDPEGSVRRVNRGDVSPRLPAGDPPAMWGPRHSYGDFVSRLWTLFGEPHVDAPASGFTYVIRETERDVDFTAFAGPQHPPGYGGWLELRELRPVLTAFEALLIETEPADCSIEIMSSTGPSRSGATGGIPWDFEPVVLPRPTSPIDAADCIYIAKQHCEAPGANWWQQGWAVCLRQILVGQPVDLDGRRGTCTAVTKLGAQPGSDVPTATISIDGTDHRAPVLSATWDTSDELVGMWIEALRTFMSTR